MHTNPQMLVQLWARQSMAPSVGHWGIEATQMLPRLCRCICTSQRRLINAQPHQEPQASTSQESQQQQQASAGQEQQQQQQQQEAGPSAGTEEAQRVFSAFQSGYSQFRSKVRSGLGAAAAAAGSSAGGGAAGQHPNFLNMVAREVHDVFRTADNIRSATRLYTGPVMEASAGDGSSALLLIKQQQTTWQKLHEKFSAFRVTDTAAYKRGQEALDDLKEKYETSDHPMVHKVDEVKERLLSGSESSRAIREVRTRDPSFDLNNFARAIKLDAPVVTRALLHKDMETLKLHLGKEMMERLSGIFRHDADKGWIEDPTILFVSDVEIVNMHMLEDDPFMVAQFHVQQIKCFRDQFGNVVEGSADSIQRVYYHWGLQMEKNSIVTADGQVLPPRWFIRDMMWQSMLALV